MSFDWLSVLYYGLGAAAVVCAPGVWAYRDLKSKQEKLERDFNEHRVQAAEKFASKAAIDRIDSKLDSVSDRILTTIIEVFKDKHKD